MNVWDGAKGDPLGLVLVLDRGGEGRGRKGGGLDDYHSVGSSLH